MIMRAILTLLSLGVFAVISKATGSPWNEEQRWVSEKLDPARYDVATRPVKNIADAVNVTVEMVLVKIVGLVSFLHDSERAGDLFCSDPIVFGDSVLAKLMNTTIVWELFLSSINWCTVCLLQTV